MQSDASISDFAHYQSVRSALRDDVFFEQGVDGDFALWLTSLADEHIDEFQALFEQKLADIDWSVALDRYDLDDFNDLPDFPYKSSKRP